MTEEKQLIRRILLKKAKGYTYRERVDEFNVGADGTKVLVKSRVSVKKMPPDVAAAKALLENATQADVCQMTDEQLQVEKLRLLKTLANMEQKTDQEAVQKEKK